PDYPVDTQTRRRSHSTPETTLALHARYVDGRLGHVLQSWRRLLTDRGAPPPGPRLRQTVVGDERGDRERSAHRSLRCRLELDHRRLVAGIAPARSNPERGVAQDHVVIDFPLGLQPAERLVGLAVGRQRPDDLTLLVPVLRKGDGECVAIDARV